jgi:hypothetical protein
MKEVIFMSRPKIGVPDLAPSLQDTINNLNGLLDGTVIRPNLSYGMNNKINNKKESLIPSIKFTGQHYINLLGKDGNCEDVSKWTNTGLSALTLDNTTKVFGTNGLKINSGTGLSGEHYAESLGIKILPNKYYFISVYTKNVYANINKVKAILWKSGAVLDSVISDDSYSCNKVINQTSFTRIGLKINTGSLSDILNIRLQLANTGGAEVFVSAGHLMIADGVMVNEITATEYALDVPLLLTKYPYVDSFACLQNPYIEVKHDNLIKNGNCEEGTSGWIKNGAATLSILNNKFSIVTVNANTDYFYQYINIKSNTVYSLLANVTASALVRIYGVNSNGTVENAFADTLGTFIFNSGNYNRILILMGSVIATTGTIDSVMLIESSTPPVTYLPCRIERTVIEGQFTSDDYVTLENGKINGQLNWNHKTLFGRDYDWQFNLDYTGFKRIIFNSNYLERGTGPSGDTQKLIKYNGSVVKFIPDVNIISSFALDIGVATTNQTMYITVSDSDTGWAETVSPNSDEVKAFMNGWGVWSGAINSRYCAWTNIVDLTLPACVPYTTITTAYTAGSPTLIVSDGTKFVAGESIYLGVTGTAIIGSISGNTLTLSSPCGGSVTSGSTVMRIDNGSTDLRILNWCKNNIAPGYQGYQLHYKLAVPENITDTNIRLRGDIPKLDVGDNYIYLDNGIVLNENTIPLLTQDSSSYRINNSWVYGTFISLLNKTELIWAVNKNGNYDNSAINNSILDDIATYGRAFSSIPKVDFDPNAIYTVDYKILSTQSPQVGTITCNYQQDILNALENINTSLSNRQIHDSSLDTLVDASIYEVAPYIFIWSGKSMGGWSGLNNYGIYTGWHMVPKKVTPIVTFNLISSYYYDSSGVATQLASSDVLIRVAAVNKNYILFNVQYIGNNSIVKTNITTYGFIATISAVMDCRGRI